ncbi:hypothetical protein [Streptomyces sp. NBC_00582]|uniref:hypothetical protein n=1 Tax=Streptomyces sp. NBC_00582 TaxID=2975783 RepID=UPI003FCCB082
MALHGLGIITVGVPDVATTANCYQNFGLALSTPGDGGTAGLSTMDGGDCVVDDQLWTPQDRTGARALARWGPPPPPSFLEPEGLAELMTGRHSR